MTKSSDEAILDDLKNAEHAGASGAEIGVEEFIIAQRAARRMKAWHALEVEKRAKRKAEEEA